MHNEYEKRIQQGTLKYIWGRHNRKVDLKRLIGVYKTTKAKTLQAEETARLKARQSEVKLSLRPEMERYSHD